MIGYLPLELLLQRVIHSMSISANTTIDLPRLRQAGKDYKKPMSDDYNLRHRAACTTLFVINQDAHLRAESKKGTVVTTAGREILVSRGDFLLRRNQVFASPCAQGRKCLWLIHCSKQQKKWGPHGFFK